MTTAVPAIEYRLRPEPGEDTCPLCGTRFASGPGIVPCLAGTDTPVCHGPGCPAEEETDLIHPCHCRFEFAELAPETIEALRVAPEQLDVAERLRLVSLDETLPAADHVLLQCAAIDLQFCEAEGTRIVAYEPRLVIETCGDAAAELLLSGCGELL